MTVGVLRLLRESYTDPLRFREAGRMPLASEGTGYARNALTGCGEAPHPHTKGPLFASQKWRSAENFFFKPSRTTISHPDGLRRKFSACALNFVQVGAPHTCKH